MAAGWQPELLFFWGHTARAGAGEPGRECLSQWYPASFVADGVTFTTAEHFMMFHKARLFGDDRSAERILAAAHPREAKAAGRLVRGFEDAKWEAKRWEIVTAANVAKFSQNAALGSYLRGTGDRVLVEASPTDTIWGIGLAEADEAARQPARWRGLNLLGFALMWARRALAGAAHRDERDGA